MHISGLKGTEKSMVLKPIISLAQELFVPDTDAARFVALLWKSLNYS